MLQALLGRRVRVVDAADGDGVGSRAEEAGDIGIRRPGPVGAGSGAASVDEKDELVVAGDGGGDGGRDGVERERLTEEDAAARIGAVRVGVRPDHLSRRGALLRFGSVLADDRLPGSKLSPLAAAHCSGPVRVWTRTAGLAGPDGPVEGTRDPLQALRHVLAAPTDAFYLFKDLPTHFDDVDLVRALRDLYHQLADRQSVVFLSYPQLRVPETLAHQLFVVELGLPTEHEILDYLQAGIAQHGLSGLVGDDWLAGCANAMKGISKTEIRAMPL